MIDYETDGLTIDNFDVKFNILYRKIWKWQILVFKLVFLQP